MKEKIFFRILIWLGFPQKIYLNNGASLGYYKVGERMDIFLYTDEWGFLQKLYLNNRAFLRSWAVLKKNKFKYSCERKDIKCLRFTDSSGFSHVFESEKSN